MSEPAAERRALHLLWVVLALLVGARLLAMAVMPLIDPAEGRYAEIGRKMAELHDYVTPWHQYGVPFWGKPPLSFWLTALSFEVLGVHEFAARLPHFLCGGLTAATLWAVVRPGGLALAWLATTVLASSLLFFLGAGAVMTDSALVMGTTLATAGVWLAMRHEDPTVARRWGWMAFVGAALGILAKGPLALVLAGAPLVLWALWCGRVKTLWSAVPWVRGLLLAAALSVPWFLMAEWRTPGFLDYFLVGEHYHRFMTPGWQGDRYGNAHAEAPGTIWAFAAGAMLPWTVLVAVLALWRRWRPQGAAAASATATGDAATLGTRQLKPTEELRFIALWALMPLLFFTASRNIIWTYALPAMPALAWAAARWMMRHPLQGLRWGAGGAALALVALMALLVTAQRIGQFDHSSGRNLVAACRAYASQARPGPSGPAEVPLVLVGRRSFSSVFYTQGQARRVDDAMQAAALVPARGTCLALAPQDEARLAEAGLRVVQRLGFHHQRHVLWVARDGQGR